MLIPILICCSIWLIGLPIAAFAFGLRRDPIRGMPTPSIVCWPFLALFGILSIAAAGLIGLPHRLGSRIRAGTHEAIDRAATAKANAMLARPYTPSTRIGPQPGTSEPTQGPGATPGPTSGEQTSPQ